MALVKYGEVTAPGGCLALVGYSNLKDWPTGFVSGGLNVLLESNGVICDARLRTREPDYQRRLTREECLLAAKMMRAMDPYDHSIPGHLLDTDPEGVSQCLARLLLSDEVKPLRPRILMPNEEVRPEESTAQPAEAAETFNVVGYERLVDSDGSSRDRKITRELWNVPLGNQYTLEVVVDGVLAKIGVGCMRWTLESPMRVVKGERVTVRRYTAQGVAAWQVVGLGTGPSDPPVEPADETSALVGWWRDRSGRLVNIVSADPSRNCCYCRKGDSSFTSSLDLVRRRIRDRDWVRVLDLPAEPPFRGYKAGPSPSLGRWAQALANVLPQQEPKSVDHHWTGHSCSKCGARSTMSATEAGCPCVTYTLLDEDNTVLSVRASPGSQVTSGGVVLKCLVGGEAKRLDINGTRHDLSTPLFRGRRSGETYRVTEGELVRVWFEGATWRIDSYPQAEPTDRTVDEILRDPPRAVLDGFGQKRGPVWERFCRALAARYEQERMHGPRRVRVTRIARCYVDECVKEATKE